MSNSDQAVLKQAWMDDEPGQWSDERIAAAARNIIDEEWQAVEIEALVAQVRATYEADRAATAARIAELEAQLDLVSRALTSTDNADRYYRGFNDGFDHAKAELQAEVERLKAGTWQPVDHVANDQLEGIHADEIAVTIGYDDTAMATFAWPEEGQYAICRKRPQPTSAVAQST